MKIRSSLLVACLVVVPLVAMFSHRIPADARAAVREFVRTASGAAARPPARLVAVPAQPTPMPAARVQPAAVQPAAANLPDGSEDQPAPVVAVMPPPVDAGGSLDRLRSLGAVAIDCRPLHGSGGHVASCRMPVDGAGQLERWFQATGADADSAAATLLRDVTAWKRDARGGLQRTMRF